ncbi:hypothetical protein THOM_0679 [Trachipleistophora hominis]|uniref:Uncharacterized protein n=1 Tax=Trachipleistophora hominis TaxID=72359 RepID=L7JZ94_TRAHO|nr:hypothetical protein THOM_0679 [Trachipleistophora hominis]
MSILREGGKGNRMASLMEVCEMDRVQNKILRLDEKLPGTKHM